MEFTQDLIKRLGWAGLSVDEQQEMARQVATLVFEKVTARCKPSLNRKQRKAHARLEGTNHDEALRLLETNVPDFRAIIEEEFERVTSQMANTQAAVMKKLGY